MRAGRWLCLGLLAWMACDGDDSTGPGDVRLEITGIEPRDASTGLTGDEIIVVRGQGFTSEGAPVSVVFRPITSPGDTLPGDLSGPRGTVLSVASTSLDVRVPPATFGATRVFVVVGADVSNGRTVQIVPSIVGVYDVTAGVASNPCDRPGVPEVALALDTTSWFVDLTGSVATVDVELPTASPSFSDDLGNDQRLSDTQDVSSLLLGELDITFTPGAFTGTVGVRRPTDDESCVATVNVLGTRTGPLPG